MLNWIPCDSTVFGTSIVKRGELGSTPTYCGGLQQLGSKKRKKHSLLDGNLEIPSSKAGWGSLSYQLRALCSPNGFTPNHL